MNLLTKSHGTVVRVWRWIAVFLGLLCVIAVLMVLFDKMNINVDINSGEQVNPYLAIVLMGATMLFACYLMLVALLFPIVYLWNLNQNKRQVRDTEQG